MRDASNFIGLDDRCVRVCSQTPHENQISINAFMIMDEILLIAAPILIGWGLDFALGDPARLPHPVVAYGKCISWCEHRLNRGNSRRLAGGITAVTLIVATYALAYYAIGMLQPWPWVKCAAEAVLIFYCLAGTTLVREVRQVFAACLVSIDAGRRQVARIVGRDTQSLSAQEVRTAAIETLAENLSDGVVAPMFWLALLGVPGMLAYKMVNTLDSMIGYRNERYLQFGCVAARIDDAANFIPARLTAFLMIATSGEWRLIPFVRRYSDQHLSPNSGWPEAAMAGLLDCRFGGEHDYFGQKVYKPYIGCNDRPITTDDAQRGIAVNRHVEIAMLVLTVAARLLLSASL